MDNIGTIFYEQSSLVGARLTDNDASPDLIDDKTQWKRRVHNQHIINNQFIIRRENYDIRRISSPRRPVRPTPPHHARYESPFSMVQAGMTMTQPYRKHGPQRHRNCHGPATLPALCRVSRAVVSPPAGGAVRQTAHHGCHHILNAPSSAGGHRTDRMMRFKHRHNRSLLRFKISLLVC